jgi:mannose-6-phosphate isomerase-like protein (cupin superfamily)
MRILPSNPWRSHGLNCPLKACACTAAGQTTREGDGSWTSSGWARSHRAKVPKIILPAGSGLIGCSRRQSPPVSPAPASHSSRVPEPRGTRSQTLIVTAGCGWVQREGGPIETIRPGDVVWFSPNEKHWHGAAATTGMTHIAIQEGLNGKVVDWMEKVTDEQYQAGSKVS